MMRAVVVLMVSFWGAIAHARQSEEVTPINKVIQLLHGMLAKGKAAKHDEEVEFAAFAQWCDSVRAEKTKTIEEAASQIVQLRADIDKALSDAEILASEVAELQASIAQAEAEAQNATAVRKTERADYTATHLDFSESIDAIQRAIEVLRSRSADVPQSLLQLRVLPALPVPARAALDSFLALDARSDSAAPEANAYEFQAGNVITMLEKLRLKFQDQRLALEKAEINARSNYELLLQQFTDDIKAQKASVAEKTAAKAARTADAAVAKGDLGSAEGSKMDDETTLRDTNGSCKSKSQEFEENQNTRAAEVEAIDKAITILSSDAVSGHGDTYLPAAMLQKREIGVRKAAPSSLAQLRSVSRGSPTARSHAADYLKSRAKELGSQYLSLVAARALDDPFVKVKKLIKDLIVKLMEQANAEADHKAYCDAELATNKQTRDNKAAEVEELTAKVERLTAESEQLSAEIQQLSDAIAEIRGQQAEATTIRSSEKARNSKTMADASEAQAAVEQAMTVLKDFYASAAGSSLLQAGRAPYKGLQAESGGVIGFLEVILSDFSRLEAGTSSAEDVAASAFAKFMAESDEDVAVKTTEMNHKTNAKRETDEENRSSKKDLGLTQDELDKALDYYSKLKSDCVDQGFSYENRVQMREEEIKSLQEALRILEGEDLA